MGVEKDRDMRMIAESSLAGWWRAREDMWDGGTNLITYFESRLAVLAYTYKSLAWEATEKPEEWSQRHFNSLIRTIHNYTNLTVI